MMVVRQSLASYAIWMRSLSDEEFENERFTVSWEAELIGLGREEALDKMNLLSVEAHRRAAG